MHYVKLTLNLSSTEKIHNSIEHDVAACKQLVVIVANTLAKKISYEYCYKMFN